MEILLVLKKLKVRRGNVEKQQAKSMKSFFSPGIFFFDERWSHENFFFRLGARLCGTIWHNPYESITYKTDKYEGRKLDVDGFERRLLHFFSDGKHLRIELVKETIKKLKILKRIVETLDSFRFYSW